MNILVGGLLFAVFYRWPIIGLALLVAAVGFVCCQTGQSPVDQTNQIQNWSPTITKDLMPETDWPRRVLFYKADEQSGLITKKFFLRSGRENSLKQGDIGGRKFCRPAS